MFSTVSRLSRIAPSLAAASLMLVATLANAGALTGSVSSSTSTTTISSYGTLDWKHWGYSSVPGPDRKSGAAVLIPDFTSVGGGAQVRTTTGAKGLSWSSGTPTASVSGTKTGVAVAGAGNGFSLSLPADAQARTVRIHVGGNNSAATFTAHLSDGSAADYTNSVSLSAGSYARQYTISYRANGPGRTLDLTWRMTSGSGSAHIFAASVPTFTYVNHSPTLAISSSYTLQQNQSAFVPANGNDIDGDTITYSATGLPAGLTINPTSGVISGLPTTAGTYSASVKATDSGGLNSIVPVTFTVVTSSTNHAPTSAAGSFTTPYETAVTITPTFIDQDVGDTWTLVLDTQPAHGTVSVNGMQFLYTPTNGYVGPDSFNFRVVDMYSAFGAGVVNGVVQAITPDQVSTVTATQGSIIGAVNLSWPAADSASDYYIYRGSSPSDPSPTLLNTTAGTSYSDATAVAGVQYYYSVKSHNATAFGAISTVTMGYADTPPTGVSATFSATLETQLQVSPSFSDPDAGDTATLAIATQPAHGVASVVSNKIYYLPANGYVGADSFTFSVTDSAGASTVGTATGTVSALAPLPVTTLTASQGTLLGSVQLSWSSASNALTYKVLRGVSPSDPSPVEIATVASTTYADSSAVPGTNYYYSIQSLTVGQSAAASPSVLGFADAPPTSASAVFAATLETSIEVIPTFSDINAGDTATFSIATQPAHGTASVAANKIYYAPSAGYVGADSFTFTVTDRAGASATGTANGTVTALTPLAVSSVLATQGTLLGSVQLNWTAATNALSYKVFRGVSASDPSPVALSTETTTSYADSTAVPGTQYYYSIQSLTIGQSAALSPSVLGFADTLPSGASATFAATLETPIQVTASYTDPDPSETASFAIVTQPAHGSASVADNKITYTPAAGYVGADSFTFSVTDRAGASATGSASGTVTALTPLPVTTVTATQGTLLGSVQLGWTAATNALSYKVFRGVSASDPSPVALSTVTTTSFADSTAVPGTPYYYSIQSLTIGQSAALSPSVLGFADTPPSGASATFAATLETPLEVSPLYTDPDAGDTATFTIVTQPTNGSASVTSNKITYVPNADYVGPDSFSFSVTDRAGASTVGTANGTVTALTPAQVASVSTSQGTIVGSVQIAWPPSANARFYNVLRGNSLSDPSPITLVTQGTTSYSDASAAPGIPYYYSVQAATFGKSAVPSPAVLGYADTPPSAATASFTTPVEVAVVVAPVFTDPDPSESFSFSIVTSPANGQATASGQTLTYRPNDGFVGNDSFTFRITDKAGAVTTGTASGNVYATPPDPVPGLTATQATRVNSVDLNWSATLNATTFSIYRSTDSQDPAPTLLSTISGLNFTDPTVRPGDQFFYFVRGNNPYLNGPISASVLGFADTPPAGPTGTFTTLEGQAVMVVPSWIDNDPGESFTLTVVTPPAHGTAQVNSGQIRYTPLANYTGSDTFQFSVTDRAGASVSGWVNGLIEPGIPDAPRTLIVSQGTILGSIKLDWQAMLGTQQYLVTRAETAGASQPDVIATIPGNSFSDTSVTPGATYYYRVIGVGASGNSPPSEQVSGYADTAPTSASASVATIFNTPVQFAPTVVDQDPLDSFTVRIDSTPGHGNVVLTADQKSFIYSPNTGWSGQDSFGFTATDQAGAFVAGSATVSVGCPAPTVGAMSVSQPKMFAGSGFKINTTYGNTGCPANLTSTLEVMSGTTLVHSSSIPTLSGVVSGPIEYAVDSLQAGSYNLRVKVTDVTTGNSAVQSMPLTVSNYRMPTFTATGTLFSNLDQATIAVGSSPDCQITNDRSAALADHRLCYYEVASIPPGLTPVSPSTFPTWTGKVSTPATYTPTLSVYQYDDFGAPKILGSIERTMTVLPVQSMAFVSPASVTVAQYMQEATVTVKQTAGSPCQITTDRAAAIQGTTQGTRMCFLEFATVSPYQTILATGIRSPFFVAGTDSVNWTISAFDLASNQIPFASGTTDVNVVPPDVQFASNAGATDPIATVTSASVRLNSTGSIGCALTVNPASANVPGVDKPCLVEWTSIPEGLAQTPSVEIPQLEGVFKAAGVNPVSFNVSYYDASGTQRVIWSATSPVVVFPPPLPEIILKAGRVIGTDIYSVPVTGGSVATLFVDTSKWPVDASVKWSDEPVERTYRINPTRGIQVIPATASTLWSRRQATIRLFLRDSPSLYVEKTIDVVSIPLAAVTLDLDQLSATVPDNARTPLRAHVSMRSPVGPLYDSQTMGQWSVQFGSRDTSGAFAPSGEPVLTNSDGVAVSSVDPFGQTLVKVQAIATPVSPYADIDLTKLSSPTRMSQVVKGTPIDATIDVKGLAEGPAPLVGIFRIRFTTRSDQLANQSVLWYVSSDGGSTWVKSDFTGVQIIQRFGEGNYQVKATLVNRNTGVSSETPPVSVSVWDVPKIKVTGPQFAFPGTPTALAVSLTQANGVVVQSGTVEWSVSRRAVVVPGQDPAPPIAVGTGDAVNFTAVESGPYMVTLRARMNSSNPNNPKAWGIAQYQVTYGAPEHPFNVISGPLRAEVGKAYTFDLQVRTKYDITHTSLKLAGRWTLPDGSQVSSLASVAYTPTEADLALGSFVTLKHEVWVIGYEDTTLQTTTKSVPIWKYVWPNWRITTSVTTPVAPTTARFTALADNPALLGSLEGLTYTWTVPSSMRTMSQPGSKLDVVADYGGSHTVSVIVSDARGNSSPLESTITVADAKAYSIEIPISNQSKWTHAPMQIGVAPKVTGGHPLDSIVEWKYFLNGTPLDLPNKNIVSVQLPQAGVYSLEARVTSKMGATGSKVTEIVVKENQPATCTIVGAPTVNRLMATLLAKCQDPDGSITKYQWTVNGVVQTFATGYKWTYVLPPDTRFPVSAELTVTDDGGMQSTWTVTIN